MNKRIKKLTKELEQLETVQAHKEAALREKLQKEYNKVFSNDKALAKALSNLEQASEYGSDDNGIYRWFRYYELANIDEDAREYLEEYLQDTDQGTVTIDWSNECFQAWEGDDNYIIQDDTRRDNGVWQGHKCIFDESDYTDENGVNVKKRNELIEKHMESTGCYPGVFRLTSYGDVFHVNTKAKS